MFENVRAFTSVIKEFAKLVRGVTRILRRSRRRITASFTPHDIRGSARGMSILDRPSMYEHYIGHRICWRCIVSKATPDEKRPTRANLELIYLEGQMNRHLIRCSVAAKKYPQLKDSTRPLYVQLFGRIQKITEETIDLTDVHLNFVSMVV